MKILVVVQILCGLSGCYAHQGHPVSASTTEWITMADDACARGDVIAAASLLERAAQTAPPDVSQTLEARKSAPCEEHP